MILDGYTFPATVDFGDQTVRFLYRPMLAHERRAFLTSCEGWGDVADKFLFDWLETHIVAWGNLPQLERLKRHNPDLCRVVCHILEGLLLVEENEFAKDWEAESQRNLRDGLVLLFRNPSLAKRSCGDCLKYLYDESDGHKVHVWNKDVERPKEQPPLCQLPSGCPVGTPERPKRLSDRNRLAWRHFQLCDATTFPSDSIVQRNAVVIRDVLGKLNKERNRGLVARSQAGVRRTVAGDGLDRGTGDGLWFPFGDAPF